MSAEPSARVVNSSIKDGVVKHSFQKLTKSKRKHITLVDATYISKLNSAISIVQINSGKALVS
jgi:aspartyl aminopeptidase